MKYYLYNPYSKNNHGYDIFKNRNDLNIVDTTKIDKMIELENTLNENDEIVICGGDGTLNYLLNHFDFIYNYDISYFKNGSGNDLHRSLSNNYQDVRTYIVNEEAIFINSMGIGFDSLVCYKTNNTKNKNKFSYLVNAISSIKEYQPQDITINYNNNEMSYKNIYLSTLANGAYFGGGFKISNFSKLDSNQLELCIATCNNKFKIIFLLLMLKINKHYHFKKYFNTIQVDNLTISSNNPLLIQLDGEIKKLDNPINIKLHKNIRIRKINKL